MNSILSRIQSTYLTLPSAMREALPLSTTAPAFFSAEQVNHYCQKTGESRVQLGLSLLPLATAFAEAPVSHFNVGAVAFDSAGNAYLGANFEFAGTHIAQTIHAEQSAIAHAWTRGARDLALLVINYAPCGHCRQFINEVNISDDFRIVLPNCEPQSLYNYLPNAFGPADLGIEARILSSSGAQITEGDLMERARGACRQSHAPYSDNRSGIALRFSDDEVVTGQYAENAAFNPSLPALQVALNTRRLQGKEWHPAQGIMMESDATLSQYANTKELLQAIAPDCHLTVGDL